MNIIIHPFGARLPSGVPNAKNYPYWEQVVYGLNDSGYNTIQIGAHSEEPLDGIRAYYFGLPLKQLKAIVENAATFVCVDSFFPHFVHVECGQKRGVVLWSQSDPNVWGHPENSNLLKDRKYLRPFQFASWGEAQFNEDAFVSPEEVIDAVHTLVPLGSVAFA
jgi:hypothetical protein